MIIRTQRLPKAYPWYMGISDSEQNCPGWRTIASKATLNNESDKTHTSKRQSMYSNNLAGRARLAWYTSHYKTSNRKSALG